MAEIVQSIGPITYEEFQAHANEHAVEPERQRDVFFEKGWTHGWRLSNVIPITTPVSYIHNPGAVTFVNLDAGAIKELGRQLDMPALEVIKHNTEPKIKTDIASDKSVKSKLEHKNMTGSSPEIAADGLLKRGFQCHYRKTKSANFRVKGTQPKEISISLARKNGVTAYVNLYSTIGDAFPDKGIEGVEVLEKYPRGHQGLNGNRGISESVARNNPSLDPASNDVLRVDVRDNSSLERLLAWYAAN